MRFMYSSLSTLRALAHSAAPDSQATRQMRWAPRAANRQDSPWQLYSLPALPCSAFSASQSSALNKVCLLVLKGRKEHMGLQGAKLLLWFITPMKIKWGDGRGEAEACGKARAEPQQRGESKCQGIYPQQPRLTVVSGSTKESRWGQKENRRHG